MKKKFIALAVLFLFTMPICVYISNIIHLGLSGELTDFSMPEFKIALINLFTNDKQLKICLLLQGLFLLFFIFVLFIKKENIYESELINVTDKIKTPIAVGQGQYGTARWMTNAEFQEAFNKNILDANLDIKDIKFKSAGLVVGYNKLKDKSEEIYYTKDDTHSITIGATRSGKTRTIVLETVGSLALAGESMIISDPKAEIYHYTSKFLEDVGYEVVVLDFDAPEKSDRYNFMQPVIDAIKRGDYSDAEEYAWELTGSLVGEDNGKTERIWRDGEMSIIAGTIMTVAFENMDHPEYQNMTNVYMFISRMCRTENGLMPLNEYIKDMSEDNPASKVFDIAKIAPEKTRGSFFTAALTTLKLFSMKEVYMLTCESDFELLQTGKKKRAIYMILPDQNTTYYPIASIFIKQQYSILVDHSKVEGGVLENRLNFILDEFRKLCKNI